MNKCKIFHIEGGTPEKLVNDWLNQHQTIKITHVSQTFNGPVMVITIFYTEK